MISSCITYFLLLQGVYATCQEDTKGCKAYLFSEQLSLVQRQAAKLEKKDAAALPPSAIQPFDCDGPHASDPIQALAPIDHTNYVDLKNLDIKTGAYTSFMNVSGVSNGCDISPKSSQMYCTSGSYGSLARFDTHEVHYVAKLPFATFAAAFGYDSDNFYFTSYDVTSKLSNVYVLPGVDSLDGYFRPTLAADKTGLTPIVTGLDGMIADLVAITGDFDGTGESEYVFGLAKTYLYLVKPTGQMWQLTFEGSWGWAFGAGWNFQNEAYFAANSGQGVVWVDKDSIDISQGTVRVEKVGESDPTDSNDGLNCHNAPEPGCWTATATEAPTATPTPAPTSTCVTGDCVIWGDPHIITFDTHHKRELQHPFQEAMFRTRNWKNDQVTVLDQGTFWLVKSEDVHIQARYWKNVTNASWTNLGSLAVGGPFLKNSTFVIRPLTGKVTWNGEEVLSHLGSEFSNDLVQAKYHKDAEIVKDGRRGIGIEVSLPQDVKLTVNRWQHGLAAKISMCRRLVQDGQCGNFNGDPKDDVQEVLLARVGHPLAEEDQLPWESE